MYLRARTPGRSHPAPNNARLILTVMMLLAIVAAVAFVAPDLIGEVRRMAYCMNHGQEAACA